MTTWPHVPDRPGARIKHGWRCTRRGKIAEAVWRTPTGQAVVVHRCLECDHDDLDAKLLDELLPGPDAA